jgi:isoleucyl-tRNA synthetase
VVRVLPFCHQCPELKLKACDVVISALTNFTTATLSTLYCDITKDTLYADAPERLQRRAAVTVMRACLDTMIRVFAPILPYLAEEAHHHAANGSAERLGETPSVFMQHWEPLGEEWDDLAAEREMGELLRVRGAVLRLLEDVRRKKCVFFLCVLGMSG